MVRRKGGVGIKNQAQIIRVPLGRPNAYFVVFPPFADDEEELLRSWRALCDTGCRYFYPGHGNPFERDKLLTGLEKAEGSRKKHKET